MTTGEKIARIRKGNNLSQEQLAEILNVSRQTVSKWENDTAVPTKENMSALSEYFSVSLSAFYRNTTDNYQTDEKIDFRQNAATDRFSVKNKIKTIFVIVLFIGLAFIIWNFHKEIEWLERMCARQSEQISQLYSYIDLLHTPGQPDIDRFTQYEYKVLDYDRETNIVKLHISIVPEEYSDSTVARFVATTSQGSHNAFAILEGHTFTAEISVYREKDTPLYLYLTDGDKVRSYLVDFLPDLAEEFMLQINYTGVVGTKVMVCEDGRLDLRNGRVDVTYNYIVDKTNNNVSVYPEIAVLEIYADGWLVDQRAITRISDKDFYAFAAEQDDYVEGECYHGVDFASLPLNEKGFGEYSVIENENISENSDIEFKVIIVDNHGVRYEKYIENNL